MLYSCFFLKTSLRNMSHKEYFCIFPFYLFSKHVGFIWNPKHLWNFETPKSKCQCNIPPSFVQKDSSNSCGRNQTLHPERNSVMYLESDPNGINGSSRIGKHGSPVPDFRQMLIPCEQVQQWISQRALVLGTGHDEVIHNHWCKHKQEKDACQGKPVHLPVIQNRAFCFPRFQADELHQTIFSVHLLDLTGWKLKMRSGHRHVWGSNSHKKLSTEHTLPQTALKLCLLIRARD